MGPLASVFRSALRSLPSAPFGARLYSAAICRRLVNEHSDAHHSDFTVLATGVLILVNLSGKICALCECFRASTGIRSFVFQGETSLTKFLLFFTYENKMAVGNTERCGRVGKLN